MFSALNDEHFNKYIDSWIFVRRVSLKFSADNLLTLIVLTNSPSFTLINLRSVISTSTTMGLPEHGKNQVMKKKVPINTKTHHSSSAELSSHTFPAQDISGSSFKGIRVTDCSWNYGHYLRINSVIEEDADDQDMKSEETKKWHGLRSY